MSFTPELVLKKGTHATIANVLATTACKDKSKKKLEDIPIFDGVHCASAARFGLEENKEPNWGKWNTDKKAVPFFERSNAKTIIIPNKGQNLSGNLRKEEAQNSKLLCVRNLRAVPKQNNVKISSEYKLTGALKVTHNQMKDRSIDPKTGKPVEARIPLIRVGQNSFNELLKDPRNVFVSNALANGIEVFKVTYGHLEVKETGESFVEYLKRVFKLTVSEQDPISSYKLAAASVFDIDFTPPGTLQKDSRKVTLPTTNNGGTSSIPQKEIGAVFKFQFAWRARFTDEVIKSLGIPTGAENDDYDQTPEILAGYLDSPTENRAALKMLREPIVGGTESIDPIYLYPHSDRERIRNAPNGERQMNALLFLIWMKVFHETLKADASQKACQLPSRDDLFPVHVRTWMITHRKTIVAGVNAGTYTTAEAIGRAIGATKDFDDNIGIHLGINQATRLSELAANSREGSAFGALTALHAFRKSDKKVKATFGAERFTTTEGNGMDCLVRDAQTKLNDLNEIGNILPFGGTLECSKRKHELFAAWFLWRVYPGLSDEELNEGKPDKDRDDLKIAQIATVIITLLLKPRKVQAVIAPKPEVSATPLGGTKVVASPRLTAVTIKSATMLTLSVVEKASATGDKAKMKSVAEEWSEFSRLAELEALVSNDRGGIPAQTLAKSSFAFYTLMRFKNEGIEVANSKASFPAICKILTDDDPTQIMAKCKAELTLLK